MLQKHVHNSVPILSGMLLPSFFSRGTSGNVTGLISPRNNKDKIDDLERKVGYARRKRMGVEKEATKTPGGGGSSGIESGGEVISRPSYRTNSQ